MPYLASPMESFEVLVRNYARHAEACAHAGFAVPTVVPIMRTVFVSRDAAQLDRVRGALAAQVATMRAQANAAMRRRMPETVEEWGIVGTPEQVLARIAEYRDRLGMTHLIATRLRIGGIDAQALEESIHTLAEIAG